MKRHFRTNSALMPQTDDGKRPSLTCATSAGKIIVHCPHPQRSSVSGAYVGASGPDGSDLIPSAEGHIVGQKEFGGDIRILNMNREVRCMQLSSIRAPRTAQCSDMSLDMIATHHRTIVVVRVHTRRTRKGLTQYCDRHWHWILTFHFGVRSTPN